MTTNWATGLVLIGSERSNNADTAFAEFVNLDELFNAWSDFDNLRGGADNDPGFHFVRISAQHEQVVAD
ncbi:hypothetical protein ACFJIY_23685 [Pimelobacter simplex]|uniref:hypothetical protein n=1 Tax=Nocardioides simplex TaxID=2045 RepID=UPI00366EA71D